MKKIVFEWMCVIWLIVAYLLTFGCDRLFNMGLFAKNDWIVAMVCSIAMLTVAICDTIHHMSHK